MYGGVIKEIINTMSSHLNFENLVLASKNANGVEIKVETNTTKIPRISEFVMVVTFPFESTVKNAVFKSKRPSTMTALLKTDTIGRMIKTKSRKNSVKYIVTALLSENFFTPVSPLLTDFIQLRCDFI